MDRMADRPAASRTPRRVSTETVQPLLSPAAPRVPEARSAKERWRTRKDRDPKDQEDPCEPPAGTCKSRSPRGPRQAPSGATRNPLPARCSRSAQRVGNGTGSAWSRSRPLNPTRRTFLVNLTRIESLTSVVANHDGVRQATVPPGTAKSLGVRWRVSKAGSSEPNCPPQDHRRAAAPAISPQSPREIPSPCVRLLG